MKKIITCLALIVLFVAPSFGGSKGAEIPLGSYYLKHNLFVVENKHLTVNYIGQTEIPINTDVDVIEIGRDSIIFLVPAWGGREFVIVNEEAYSCTSLEGLFERTFSKSPVEIGSYEDSIINGVVLEKVRVGMTKDDVIKALGYPPCHKTPALESRSWIYWINRFNKAVVVFDDSGVVIEVSD